MWFLCVVLTAQAMAQDNSNAEIKKVIVIFKTHFDLGYTELSSTVEERYVRNFIPKAIELSNQLREEGGEATYVWTTGSWLINAYLKHANSEEKSKLEKAIQRGDIVWNAAPYTIQSESTSKDLFEGMLNLTKMLDKQFNKITIAAKMTDVPGHTRSIITPMFDAGIRLLHIGVNNCSTVPVVPPICRWRNTDGKELILMYQDDYGNESVLPDGKTVISFNFTGDNNGPHTADQVKAIFKGLKERYPNAKLVTSSLNDVAQELLKMSDQLPVLTSEIGDTWIYGYASSPVAMSRYRELMRLYSKWLKEGKLNKNSDMAINYAVTLGLFAEHTWGIDHLVHLRNWDKLEHSKFNISRNLPEFRLAEKSWEEKAFRVDDALNLLPENLKKEAVDALKSIGETDLLTLSKTTNVKQLNWDGSLLFNYNGAECVIGQVAYQTYSADDYNQFVRDYVRCDGLSYYFTKPGLEKTDAVSRTIVARKVKASSKRKSFTTSMECLLSFPIDNKIAVKDLPQQIYNQYQVSQDGKSVELVVNIVNKPAVRMPEAYWVSFFPANVIAVLADKMGMSVDVSDVVIGGNRQMHGFENHIDVITGKGTIRITSLDAAVASFGERRAMNYSLYYPDINAGIHFCLFNNLWTTNFNAWWEGSLSYRFKIEYLL